MAAVKALALFFLTLLPAFGNGFDRKLCGHNLPGHFVKNHCYEYATALKEQLRIHNIESVWVGYDWQRSTCKGRHVGVIFRYHGSLWWMDNFRIAPALVRSKTDLGAMQALSGDRRIVAMVDGVTGERRFPQLLDALLESSY